MVTPALNSFPDGQFLCAVLSVKYPSQAREAAVWEEAVVLSDDEVWLEELVCWEVAFDSYS